MQSTTSSSKPRKNYYEILGLKNNATSAEIDSAYKKLSSQHHPDKNKNNRQEAQMKFNEICEAYDILSNKNKRSHYDEMMSKTFTDEDADKTFERFFEEHGMQEQSEKKFFDQYYPDRKKNYYEILGVSKNASMDEIKKAYRKLALKNHPRTNPNNPEIRKKFNEINEAFNALRTQARRQNYDTLFFETMVPFRASNIFEDFWGNRFNEIDTMDEMFKPMMRTGWVRDMDRMFNLGETSAIKNGQTQKSSYYYTNNNGIQTKKTITTNTKYINGIPTSETTQEYEFPDGNKEVKKIKDDGHGNVTSKIYNLKKGQALPITN